MPLTSVTRLRLRGARFVPLFAFHAWRATRQVRGADGFVTGEVRADRGRTFWTLTLWRDVEAMRAYMRGGAHGRAMPGLARWCDEASVVHYETAAGDLDWTEAVARMRRAGRPSKLRHPGPDHATLGFAPPRDGPAVPIRRALARR